MSSLSHPLGTAKFVVECAGELETQAFAAELAPLLGDISLVTLKGNLGAGKTTLVRALLGALGFEGRVKSPTYALVEPYQVDGREIFHFDLYRLSDPEELDYLGLDDYFSDSSLCLVEWAEKGEGMLPAEDLQIELTILGEGREIWLSPRSDAGLLLVAALDNR